MTTALRITHTGGNVDFDQNEVGNENLIVWKNEEVQINGNVPPYLYELGTEYDTIQLSIIHYYSTTRAKIETLVNLTESVTVYYNYIYAPTDTKTAILDPKNVITKRRYFGEHGATFTTVLIYMVNA